MLVCDWARLAVNEADDQAVKVDRNTKCRSKSMAAAIDATMMLKSFTADVARI
jgi:hypothetical protein